MLLTMWLLYGWDKPSNSCNKGMSALPDMYVRHLRASADISGNALVLVLQLYVTFPAP